MIKKTKAKRKQNYKNLTQISNIIETTKLYIYIFTNYSFLTKFVYKRRKKIERKININYKKKYKNIKIKISIVIFLKQSMNHSKNEK